MVLGQGLRVRASLSIEYNYPSIGLSPLHLASPVYLSIILSSSIHHRRASTIYTPLQSILLDFNPIHYPFLPPSSPSFPLPLPLLPPFSAFKFHNFGTKFRNFN